nr:urease accessory protein UreE [uncultured Lichenicoccus sp.]
MVVDSGSWDPALESGHIVADHDQRHRRRILLRTEAGREILLDLAQARHLRHGDGLLLDEGGIIRIEAAPERLLLVTAPDAPRLMRIAWHLGNRHLPTALQADRLLIREDHVIADMVRGLGGTVSAVEAPFDPETGAYAAEAPAHHHHDP